MTKTSQLLLCAYPAYLAAVERTQHLLLSINKNSLPCRSFFELLLFFSKEEFLEKPLKDILDSFQVRTTQWLMSIQHGQTQKQQSSFRYLCTCMYQKFLANKKNLGRSQERVKVLPIYSQLFGDYISLIYI